MDTIISAYGTMPGDGPKYRRLADAIRARIAAGQLAAGQKLPPVRDLAYDLGITPGTVARAYTILTDSGLAEAQVGRGTFIAAPEAASPEATFVWHQPEPSATPGLVSLYSPRLPDRGQVQLIQSAFARLAAMPADRLLNYPSRAGFRPARQAVLDWLGETPLGPVSEQDMVLSHGGQNGIGLVMQAVLRGTRPTILVEELSYPGFRRAADLLRAEVVAVPMDGQGLIPEELDRLARKHDAQLLCTSPEIHNPTGLCTPLARREAVVEVAARRGFHILDDDCYRLGRPAALSYRAILPEQSWYVSSISKTITPALRVGFTIAPKGWRSELRRVAEHGFFGLAQPLADLVCDLLRDPALPHVLGEVRAAYARYIRAAVNGLGAFDITWREDMPFLWLRLPAGWRAAAFVQAAEVQGVQLRAADEFALRDGFAPHAVRLSINAQVPLAEFEAAIGRLRALLDDPPERIAV
ncbi:transcriptional regulator, GntR family [Roseivivax lentus]|uniref:Transcriptional regulator, GntR family n=1 Tax=Roseivivax lentus TaxID=633194 RepID=A0A1N7MZ54_9RHOB|nr:PLP-dependent aminotransferase family protein [Roseivivax lentus]SIS91221.1 transcriptional regulator, GntR family [Roseivivax lentus]